MRRTFASVVELATITRPSPSRSSGSTSSSPACQSGADATSSTTAQTSSIGASSSTDASPPSRAMAGVLPEDRVEADRRADLGVLGGAQRAAERAQFALVVQADALAAGTR